MLASKTLMHESFGHNKILFSKKDRLVSPLRFYNKKKSCSNGSYFICYKTLKKFKN